MYQIISLAVFLLGMAVATTVLFLASKVLHIKKGGLPSVYFIASFLFELAMVRNLFLAFNPYACARLPVAVLAVSAGLALLQGVFVYDLIRRRKCG